jgi:hypothetical protein
MKFGEKIRRALQKIKGRLIVYILVILVGIFGIVAPVSRAITDAINVYATEGTTDAAWETFFMHLSYITQIGENIVKVFTKEYFHNFWIGTKYFVLFAVCFIFVGVYKALPKHEYDDIENGSSDWATGGEQYRVLSKKSGIILAEKNYLPVDKRGNVNVLVVRRFWCW